MEGSARIVVGPGRVGFELSEVRSEPPFAVRRSGGRVILVSSAAAPVGGDRLALDLVIRSGVDVEVGTAAATMVWPGVDGARSHVVTTVAVEGGAHLDLRPEPTVSVAGSDHRISTLVRLEADATCHLVEEVALGRVGEPSGRLELEFRVERGGVPLIHHTELFGPGVPGTGSVVGVGRARHVLTAVVVGAAAGSPRTSVDSEVAAAWLPVADDAAIVVALGPDRPATLAVARAVGCERVGAWST
jgi:urease accessory protein